MLKEMFKTTSPSVIDMLKEDHRKVETLFEEFEAADDRRTKARIVRNALQELEVHAALEEKVIYPAIRAQIDDDDLMDEALEEHHVVHMLIGELKRMQPSDERYDAKFKVLVESVKHHVKEEESEVFPKAEQSNVDSPELAEKVLAQKTELLERPAVRARRHSKRVRRGGRRRAA